jgi:phosphoglycolate phosphatase-like HAD superfamily hydrolase
METHSQKSELKPYFVGIDSDGTAFDSMEIKHRKVFQPVAVDIWGLQSLEREFCEEAEFINLYSTHRGVNRFQGLAMVFERLRCRPELLSRVPDPSGLRDFVLSGRPLSVRSLEEYAQGRTEPFLSEVIAWSQRSDQEYARVTASEGNPAYPLVRDSLERARLQAELWIISSSSRAGLQHDWGEADLLGLIDRVAGQEMGNKTVQLQTALQPPRTRDHSLMIGDAPGDLDAARAAGTLFFPILPGREKESWERFHREALDRFFAGTFAGDYERALQHEFAAALCEDVPWP